MNKITEILCKSYSCENPVPQENNVKILNYTPHDINIGDICLVSSGVARVDEEIMLVDEFFSCNLVIPVIKKRLGEVQGLPEYKEECTHYVVSLMVAQALPNRNDLLIPGELVRNEKGVITGCKSLCRL